MVVAMTLFYVFHVPAGTARAQELRAGNEAPARIDNIWGGFDHQPTEFQVQSAERARDVAPSSQQQRRETRIVRQLYREVLKNSEVSRSGAAAG
jgi:hypothetical protein